MAPAKKNDEKITELADRVDERIDAIEKEVGKISSLERCMESLMMEMKQMTGDLGKIRLGLTEQTKEKDRREEGPLSSGLISHPAGVFNAPVYQGEGSGKSVERGPRYTGEARFMGESRLEGDSFTAQQPPWRVPEDKNFSLSRRMEIPLFDGTEAESWVLRIDQYFEIGDFTEEDKMRAVRLCFTGEALSWYRWERNRNPFECWEQIKSRILKQFSTVRDSSAGERLLSLRQTSSVKKFRKEFIALASNAPEIPDSVLVIAFQNGLQPKIRAGVKLMEPRGLEKIMNVAELVDEWSGEGESSEKGEGDSPEKGDGAEGKLGRNSSG